MRKEMKEITKGIKEMAKLGFILEEKPKHATRKFVKCDADGRITDTINYFYSEENGVEVYTNSLQYGCGSKLDTELLNAIQLNFNELKELENEEKLIEELIAYSKIAVDPISAIEMLLKTQDYNKVEYRKQEILELIKNEKLRY